MFIFTIAFLLTNHECTGCEDKDHTMIQSLPLESAFYTVFLAILTHKNGSPKAKISILCFKDALTPT